MPSRRMYRIAIVGATSLKGKDLNEVLEERNFPAVDVKLLDDDEVAGQLDAVGEEPTFIQSIRPEQFQKVDFVFFACDPQTTLINWQSARSAGSAVIDLSYALEDEAGVQVRSPWISLALDGTVPLDLETNTVVAAHPAAVVLALLMVRAQKAGAIRHANVTIFEPVSENGKQGMDELHQQTVHLLGFQPVPDNIYGDQIAFNLVASYGKSSALSLEATERRIVSHFKRITKGRAAIPSVRLVQAPVFHSYTFSLYLEMLTQVSAEELVQVLAGDHVAIMTKAPYVAGEEPPAESPSNVSAAGSNDVLLSLRQDPEKKNGFWLWIAADNFKIAAITASDCAAGLAASYPVDKVQ